ncbi:MAG: fructosamine kinase [Flavobacteriaceae bacterium]|nr:fructosamine kinase [Flavobacteriaceae bacterium]
MHFKHRALMKIINTIIEKYLDSKLKKVERLSGGSINEVYLCYLINKKIVLKINDKELYPKMFEKEKQGLNFIRKYGFKTPEVIGEGCYDSYSYLAIEYIESGNSLNWKLFGRELALLHLNQNNKFGLDHDNYIGSLCQLNTHEESWQQFYTQYRILPLVKIARDKHLIEKKNIQKIEYLCSKLDTLLPECKPSLIHGDLWSGNLIYDQQNNPVLIDPAVYYGHPEMDWAMLSLFGNYTEVAFRSYCELNYLEKGFKDREGIHQLYPLLVHLILFGKSYFNQVYSIIKKFG